MTKTDLEKLEKFKPHEYKKYYVRIGYDNYKYAGRVGFTLKCTKLLKPIYEVIRLNGKIEITENPKCKFGDLDRVRQMIRSEEIILESYSVDNLLENYKWVIDINIKKKIHYKIYRDKLRKLFLNVEINQDCRT